MSLWERLTGEFVDVIDWKDDSSDTLVWRFERWQDAIKQGAKLTVREGQVAIFVSEGQLADVFPPGLYSLETRNLPVLTTIRHWDHGFNSPFKADVYFVSTRRFTDLKWGTRNPIMLRDPEFGPIRLRAFGSYTLKVADAPLFLREVVGTDGHFTTEEISNQLRNLIVAKMAEGLATSGVPVLDLAANYEKLGRFVTERTAPLVRESYGIDLLQLLVENVSLPPAVEQALDKRSSMGVIGDLDRYTRFQAAEALGEGGTDGALGAGIGLGAGMAMAQQVAGAFGATGAAAQSAASATPPPLPRALNYHVAIAGAAQGPFDGTALRRLVTEGKLGRDSMVWTAGMADWARASERPDLAELFADQPPPLPPG
ncbi:SPFH domain-containing protein [Geminicoccus harenae]|uniref:SPFH domain-containing protein n=3 Tax=Geminicoccus harenae TaxID=2498453 RepID=UPI001C95884C|nr:SPFH domain-containing protein [Geminicoccus harenae]